MSLTRGYGRSTALEINRNEAPNSSEFR